MKFSKTFLLIFFSINSLFNLQDANAFVIRIQQSGADVLFSFDGSIDLTGSTVYAPTGTPMNRAVRQTFVSGSNNPAIWMGGNNGTQHSSGHIYKWNTGVNVPAFGTNANYIDANSGYTVTGSGDLIALYNDNLVLPQFYDESNIIGEMRFANASIDGLGITPGTYSYTLGNNTMEIVATPAPLPIMGLPVVFSYFKKLKEKSRLQR